MRSARHKNDDLHGNVPDNSPVVLLLIDVINDLDFPGNANLLKQAPILAENIRKLKARCRRKGIPVIYVNDNRNKWRSDIFSVIEYCRGNGKGRVLVESLIPSPADYFVLKPKHSAFYATPLDTLLVYMKTRTVILAGLTTASCILLTAGEIYIRDLKLFVPSDCVAGLRPMDHRKALDLMRISFRADTRPAKNLNLKILLRESI
jgi:nicotinamidase-related amidase